MQKYSYIGYIVDYQLVKWLYFGYNRLQQVTNILNKKNMEKLIQDVVIWGHNKNLIKKENSYKQFCKVVEEVAEIGTALNHNSETELIDAIGDATVTLIILAAQNKLNFEYCLKSAYEVIKNRTGKTENGVFIKS